MKKISSMMFAFAISLLMFSCQKEGNPLGNDDLDNSLPSQISSDILPTEIVDNINMVDLSQEFGTDISDFTFEPMLMGREGHRPPFDKRKKDWRPKKDRDSLELNLTDEQKEAIKAAREAYIDCSKEYRTTLMEISRAVFEAANAKRMDIITKLRSGEITREEARTALKELKEATKAELENNADFQAALTGIKACEETLKAAMDSILTDAQKEILKRRHDMRKNMDDRDPRHKGPRR